MLIRLGAANLFPYISSDTRKGKHLHPVVAVTPVVKSRQGCCRTMTAGSFTSGLWLVHL